jgi:hypothetical protein
MYDYYYDNDNGNKFGEGIPYRKGKAIQLIKYENEKIILNKESLEIIKNIEEPIAIISVGNYNIHIYFIIYKFLIKKKKK